MGTNEKHGVKKAESSPTGVETTEVKSEPPKNKEGHINPSAPEDSNVTPGTAGTK